MENCRIIAIANQKGGTGKTTTARNLGSALADAGKRVLMIDFDPQSNLTMSFGVENPDELSMSMHDILWLMMDGKDLSDKDEYILHKGNLDLIPCNINLSATEMNLHGKLVGREYYLSRLLEPLREYYDYIVADTNPYLGLLTINALTACNEVIIPASPQLWSATGLTDLIQTIFNVRDSANPRINIAGILLTMCDERTRLFRDAKALLEKYYDGKIKIFKTLIPSTVKVGEANYSSRSIFEYDGSSKAALAYKAFAEEVLSDGR